MTSCSRWNDYRVEANNSVVGDLVCGSKVFGRAAPGNAVLGNAVLGNAELGNAVLGNADDSSQDCYMGVCSFDTDSIHRRS